MGSVLWVFNFLHSAFRLGPRKEADSGVRPTDSRLPSVVLEVGDSESLSQLKIDAKLWLEHMPEVSRSCPLLQRTHKFHQVQLVILVLIDPPKPSHPNLPSNCGEASPPASLHAHPCISNM